MNKELFDFYRLLGCKEGDSPEKIKKAYRDLVKECHPDILSAAGLSTELIHSGKLIFNSIQDAYYKVSATF